MINPASYQAILFDMDGTLVNTEPLHEEAWYATLAQYDLNLSPDWFHRYTGATDRILMTDVVQHYGLSVDVGVLLEEKRQRFLDMATTRSQTFAGVIQGLQQLQSHFILAVVTSSSRLGAMAVFRATQLLPFFQTIVTFDDIRQPKPNPEPYLLAAKTLGISPENCIAVEDSVSGSKAAQAAGCYTLGVLNSVAADELTTVDQVFPDTQAAMNFLTQLITTS